jgi:hypothetical protein
MTRFWSFFIEKRHFTVFLMISLLAGGLYAVSAIPKESTPDITIPLGVVTTVLPGASAADIERLVTDKNGVLDGERLSGYLFKRRRSVECFGRVAPPPTSTSLFRR